METDKYYTPTIEEFHIGFEYEYKSTFLDGTVKSKTDYNNAQWIKGIFTLNNFMYIERALTNANNINCNCGIRIKYLDEIDILSLGFIFDEGTSKQYSIINKDGETYSIDLNCLERTNSIRDGIGIIIYNDIIEQLFIGYIKNKSELKLLLSQLNIL